MRRHATRVLRLEFRAKRVGTESNPAAPVYVKVVETTAPTDVVEVELTLPAGACTVQAKANHWLRGEMAVVSSVPWIFAAPTGANKVTVYWDEVAGATGYRVRWGTVSGSYPHSSPVLPADARQWSITGLVTEQTYYVVVQAEYNGLWGPPSEEDSAVPHVGAIPWDSENPSAIMASVRAITGAGWGQLEVVSPNGVVYSDLGSSPPYAFTQEGTDIVTYSDGTWAALLKDSEELENTKTGPYRRVRARLDSGIIGVRARFWLPGWAFISVPPTRPVKAHGDAPCVYFGFAYANMDVEAGVMFHPAWRPEDWQGARHDRWQVFFHYRKTGQRKPKPLPVLGSPTNPRHHILVGPDSVMYGVEVNLSLLTVPRSRFAYLRVEAYDDISGEQLYLYSMGGWSKLPGTMQGLRFRRVCSIAQTGLNTKEQQRIGYVRTGSRVVIIGVGYSPVFRVTIDPPAQVFRSLFHEDWTESLTDQAGWFPQRVQPAVIRVNEIQRYGREILSIDLSP